MLQLLACLSQASKDPISFFYKLVWTLIFNFPRIRYHTLTRIVFKIVLYYFFCIH